MRKVEISNMTFEESVTPEQIAYAVNNVAERINRDYAGREPLFICILNGAFIYAADLFRKITLHSEITFVRLKSYTGMSTTGEIRELIGLSEPIEGRDVIIIEDIVDTGHSMHYYKEKLLSQGAKSVAITAFFFKPEALKYPDAKPDYIGMEIAKEFIIGYGLDLDGYARNLDAIYKLKS